MTRLLGILALVLLCMPRPLAAGELTVRDVIELHRSGLGDELLIAVIEADGGPFELALADILDLRNGGLSERVISAMVRTGGRRSADRGDAGVNVQQHVTQVAPTVVIIDGGAPSPPPSYGDWRPSNFKPEPGQIPPTNSPARWTTRRSDGRNVSEGRPVTSDKPAASWVTPRSAGKAADGEKKPSS
jgi:hypothetical protein